jgi:hypothetical protein
MTSRGEVSLRITPSTGMERRITKPMLYLRGSPAYTAQILSDISGSAGALYRCGAAQLG